MARRGAVSESRAPAAAERSNDADTASRAPRRSRQPPGLDNLTAQARRSRERDPPLEREAETVTARIQGGERVRLRKGGLASPTLSAPDGGRPLSRDSRELAERGLGLKTDAIRIHDGPAARSAAMAMGARAFADGGHIWLGPGESEHDRELMAHELAHVAQGADGPHLRSATWLERRAWLAFFDHYLPRKFLNNYMDDTGAAITLSITEMMDCNPIVNIRRSAGFATELGALQAQVKASNAAGTPMPAVKYIEVSGPGQALTNGTLGNFTIHYKGVLSVNPDGTWLFAGGMDFYDFWDFDPKPFGTSGRSWAGEVKVMVADIGLPGSPFDIFSVSTVCVQNGSDQRAVWAGGTPTHIGDKAGRTGADIATGDVGGGDVGGELGAQSAEDLNP